MKYLKVMVVQAIFVLAILTGYSYYKYPFFRENIATFIRLSTTSIPESLTELYFEKHLELPKAIAQNQATKFSFTVHNLENMPVEYSYIVYSKNDKGMTPLEKGNFASNHDEYKTLELTLPILENIRTKIVVQLSGVSSHEIAFWMEPRP